jgi:hypothetical protein
MFESPYLEVGSGHAPIGAVDELIADLNAEILEAHAGTAPGLQQQWRTLGGAARLRLAHCPFLLVDAGFARPELWADPPTFAVHEALPLRTLLANRSALAAPLLRRVLSLAWYVARNNRMAARIALGMSAGCASSVARWRQMDLDALAERRPAWIRPRWDQHPDFWHAWLSAAAQEAPRRLECLKLWGLQKLAADVRRQTD